MYNLYGSNQFISIFSLALCVKMWIFLKYENSCINCRYVCKMCAKIKKNYFNYSYILRNLISLNINFSKVAGSNSLNNQFPLNLFQGDISYIYRKRL